MAPESSPSPTSRPSSAPDLGEADDLWLKVWRLHPRGCPIVAAERTLHGTAPEGAARFCGPFTHANKAGWWLFPPVDIDITWRGGLEFEHEVLTEYSDVDAVLIDFLLTDEQRPLTERWLPGGRTKFTWGLVEPGVVQLWTGAIFQTPPGWGLHVRSPINWAPRDLHVMEAVLETDWLHTDIWLNLKFDTVGQKVSLRRNSWPPLAQLVPVPRQAYDTPWRMEEATLHRRSQEADQVFSDFVDYNNKKFAHGGRQRWSAQDPSLTKDSTTYYRERRRVRSDGAPASRPDPALGASPPPSDHTAIPLTIRERATARDSGPDQSIRLAYGRYVTGVSRSAHAISLQLAFHLWAILAERAPRRVVDLGSGFSSYLFSLYARERAPELEVWSVDDDPAWLERTRAFLTAEGLSTDRTLLWPDLEEKHFELVLHDLGTMTTRERTLPAALSLGAPGSAIVLDDLHFARYRAHVERTLATGGFRAESVEAQTRDPIGRFSWVCYPE